MLKINIVGGDAVLVGFDQVAIIKEDASVNDLFAATVHQFLAEADGLMDEGPCIPFEKNVSAAKIASE